MTRITIEKKPFPTSAKYDFATFDMEGSVTEEQVIEEFSKVVRELGWFEKKESNFECHGEFTKCGVSTAESDPK